MALTGREQAVLALHRFGLGPRPSSVVAIASDPRGALLAELDRPGAGLIAGADLQTSAQAFRAVADANAERQAKQVLAMRKQKEIERQQAEGGSMGDGMQEAASGTPPAAMAPEPPRADGRPRHLPQGGEGAHRRCARRRDRFRGAAGVVLVEPLLHLRQQDPEHGRRLRARGDPPARAGPLRRPCCWPSRAIRRCCSISTTRARSDPTRSPASTATAASTRTWRARSSSCTRWACAGGYTQDDVVGFRQGAHRLDLPARPRQSRARRRVRLQSAAARAGTADRARQESTPTRAWSRAVRCCATSPVIPPPQSTSPPSSRAISWPTSRRRLWSSAWRETFTDTDGDLKEVSRALVAAPEAWAAPRIKLKRPGEWVMAMVRAAATHRRPRALRRRPGAARRAAVAPAVAQGSSRRRRSLDRRPRPAPRHRQQLRRAHRRPGRPAGHPGAVAGRARERRHAQRHRPRREPPAGAGAPVHVTRVSAEVVVMAVRLHAPTRRELLLGSGVLFAWAHVPRIARAEGRDPRMLVIVLRGALDGLADGGPGRRSGLGRLARRQGSPARRQVAGPAARLLLRAQSGHADAAPALQGRAGHHRARRRHALSRALPFRRPGHARERTAEAGLQRDGLAQPRARRDRGRAVASTRKGAQGLRRRPGDAAGGARVGARACRGCRSGCCRRATTRSMRLLDLYSHTDPALARALEARRGLLQLARAGGMDTRPQQGPQPGGIAGVRAYFADAAGTAAKYLARPDGPRVGAVGFVGWDTHINEGAVGGQLGQLLGALDGAIAAIETNMGSAWRETVVAIVTEFGRTARLNGNEGTDHGTATTALLIGGALKGGRVIADWPGLKPAQPARGSRPQAHDRPARRPQGRAQGPRAGGGCGARQRRVPGQRRRQADGRTVRVSAAFPEAEPRARPSGTFPLQSAGKIPALRAFALRPGTQIPGVRVARHLHAQRVDGGVRAAQHGAQVGAAEGEVHGLLRPLDDADALAVGREHPDAAGPGAIDAADGVDLEAVGEAGPQRSRSCRRRCCAPPSAPRHRA